jgi:hypothetical protein
MGDLNLNNGSGSNLQGGSWIDRALQLGGQPPAPSPVGGGGMGSPGGLMGWLYKAAQARNANGKPTPFADKMGWFSQPPQAGVTSFAGSPMGGRSAPAEPLPYWARPGAAIGQPLQPTNGQLAQYLGFRGA